MSQKKLIYMLKENEVKVSIHYLQYDKRLGNQEKKSSKKEYVLDLIAPTSTTNSIETQRMEKCFPYVNKTAKSVVDLITLYVSMISRHINQN